MTPPPESPVDTPLAVALEGGGAPVPVPEKGALIVGSSSERAQVVVHDRRVAPAHLAVARIKGGGYGVRELEGATGTRVNGRPATRARVAAGDTLTVGRTTLTLVAQAAASDPDGGADDSRGGLAVRLPERVGGFRVARQLGRGSMGRVYLAVQESLQREVALKVLRTRLALDKEFVARFQAEARSAAALNHPNVVHVYDVGSDDGLHWLALEYMDRGSLEDRLRHQGPLPWRAVLGVLRDAAGALEFAESKGLVHRDVKPANLMQNSAGATKLVDLGLATAAESDAAELEDAGAGGRKIVGTAHFMAPEQARGEPLDHRADLYALGASAWRLLTARTPFEGASAREILKAALTTEPPSVRAHAPDCPEAVERLVLDLMRKDRDARPASARVVRERVEALAGGAAADGDEGGEGGRGSRTALLVGGAVLVLAGVGAGLWAAFAPGGDPPAPAPPRVAEGGPVEDVPDVPDGAPPPQQPPPGPGAQTPDGGIGAEDAALAALEENARRRLDVVRALAEPADREVALRRFAVEYAGTTAATEATELADALAAAGPGEASSLEADVAAAIERAIADLEATLRGADGAWLRPAEWRRALGLWEAPTALAGSTELAAAELALEDRAERDFRATHSARTAAAWNRIDAGEFEAAEAELDALLDWHAPPEAPETDEQAGEQADEQAAAEGAGLPDMPRTPEELSAFMATGTLRSGEPYPMLAADVRTLRAALPELGAQWADAMEERDRTRAAAEVIAGDALDALLAEARYDAAADRLDAFAATCRSTVVAGEAAVFAAWLRDAARAPRLLVDTRASEGWLRQSVPIPNERRGIGEAVSVSADGIAVDSGGSRRQIGWAEFASDASSLDPLFNRRVQRDWRPDERAAIAAWMGVAGLRAALVELRPVLGGEGRLSEGERANALEALASARAWSVGARADGAGSDGAGSDGAGSDGAGSDGADAAARESAAVGRVADALRAVDRGDWPAVAYQLEALFAEHRDALATWLLADGRPTAEPVVWPVDRAGYRAPRAGDATPVEAGSGSGEVEVGDAPIDDPPDGDAPDPDSGG